jgi:uncharacterized protein YlaI
MVECFICKNNVVSKVNFTWWTGEIISRLLRLYYCPNCDSFISERLKKKLTFLGKLFILAINIGIVVIFMFFLWYLFQ